MKNKKMFTKEEKNAYLKQAIESVSNQQFNELTRIKEKNIRNFLIMIECALIIGSLFVFNYNWSFDWIININCWLTNIFVPFLIFNLTQSIWLLVTKKIKRIKLWMRLLFYFLTLFLTFFISSSLRLELVNANPLLIVFSIVVFVVTLVLFILNAFYKTKLQKEKYSHDRMIEKEIMDDFNEIEQ